MTKIRCFFDDVEYFRFTGVSGSWSIENNFVFKEANLSAITNVQVKNFVADMKAKGRMLARLVIDNQIFIESFVTGETYQYQDTATGGTEIQITLRDRFVGLKKSDIIKTKPVGNLQNFLSLILTELEYTRPDLIQTYNRKIKKSDDFILNGTGVLSQKIKSFTRNDIVEKDSSSMIGEALSLSNLMLVSNGYDTLYLEKTNAYPDQVFAVTRTERSTNVLSSQKVGNNSEPTPQTIVILNSSGVREDGKKKLLTDQNSSVITHYKGGMPNIKRVKHLSVGASYQDIRKSIDFHFAGIEAAANTYIYRISNSVFDDNGDFFRPNRLVMIKDDKYLINELMQILAVTFDINPTSTEVALNVTTQNSFDDNASIKNKRKTK